MDEGIIEDRRGDVMKEMGNVAGKAVLSRDDEWREEQDNGGSRPLDVLDSDEIRWISCRKGELQMLILYTRVVPIIWGAPSRDAEKGRSHQ